MRWTKHELAYPPWGELIDYLMKEEGMTPEAAAERLGRDPKHAWRVHRNRPRGLSNPDAWEQVIHRWRRPVLTREQGEARMREMEAAGHSMDSISRAVGVAAEAVADFLLEPGWRERAAVLRAESEAAEKRMIKELSAERRASRDGRRRRRRQ